MVRLYLDSVLTLKQGQVTMDVGSYSVDSIGDYLLESGIPPDIVTSFLGKVLTRVDVM